jgi:RHS repeat-associated protein
MAGTGGNQGSTGSQSDVVISTAGQSHMLGAGFAAGNVAIATSATMTHGWGKPNSNAIVAATVVGDTTKATLFGYDTGATMVSGTAAARRVNYPLTLGLATAINDNGVQLFDAAVAWASGKSPKIAYKRDATDRITERTVNARVVARYSYTASGDTSDLTLDGSNNVIEATLALPGGALYTWRSATPVWSYANTHGDIVVTANTAGVKQGPTRAYDPYGQSLTTTAEVDNSAGEFDYGWLGEHQRPLEHQSGAIPVIEMGARQYDPYLGRFIEVDPIEGGSANDYDYAGADPVNSQDLDGERRRRSRRANQVTRRSRSTSNAVNSQRSHRRRSAGMRVSSIRSTRRSDGDGVGDWFGRKARGAWQGFYQVGAGAAAVVASGTLALCVLTGVGCVIFGIPGLALSGLALAVGGIVGGVWGAWHNWE